jgi:hypothetical protein
MRVVAFLHPEADFEGTRARLLAVPGVTAVACRNARYWLPTTYAEPGFDSIYAPGYPGIVDAYRIHGTKELDGKLGAAPIHHEELETLPQADHVTIVCPGKFVREELTQHPPTGAVIAVNEAAHVLPRFDYFIANDGFADATIRNVVTDAVRVTQRRYLATKPSGPWFAIDRLGISDGMFTVRCALRLAEEVLKAKTITLIGHDCIPGFGTGTASWDVGHMESCRNAVEGDLYNLTARGVSIDHIRWVDGKAVAHEHRPQPVAAMPETKSEPSRPRPRRIKA